MLDLADLRLQWKLAVCFEPHGRHSPGVDRQRPRPCWFQANVPGIDPCSGPLQGAHWIKRQRVERELAYRFEVPLQVLRAATKKDLRYAGPEYRELVELIWLAAWDPRNGVCACEHHHKRFDGQTVRAAEELVINRHEVPVEVEAFCRDWGFETALEDRCPAIGAGI